MPIAIQNLVVLGDSLSDIGIKREAPTGMFARAGGMMRTNEIGRYSDGKNWTDFLVEWMGGDPLVRATRAETESATAPHRKMTDNPLVIGTRAGDLDPVGYSNFAEGGAIAASDWTPKLGALGTLKQQVDAYIAARRKLLGEDIKATGKTSRKYPLRRTYTIAGTATHGYDGPTLHIIWIGLNDLITAKRPVPDSGADKPGVGVGPMVQEIHDLINQIPNSLPTNPSDEHFLLVDLPSPMVSVRFQERSIDKGEEAVEDAVKKVAKFNDALHYTATHWPAPGPEDGPGATPANISIVAMADFMQHVFDHAKEFELQKLPQKHGPVRYLGMAENMPDPGLRRAMTTSDLAHPTEAVYQLIARQIVDVMLTKYTLGQLNPQSWPALRPYPNV